MQKSWLLRDYLESPAPEIEFQRTYILSPTCESGLREILEILAPARTVIRKSREQESEK